MSLVLLLIHGAERVSIPKEDFPESLLGRIMTNNSLDLRLPRLVIEKDEIELHFERCLPSSVFENLVEALQPNAHEISPTKNSRSWLALLGWLSDFLPDPRSAVDAGFSNLAEWYEWDQVLGQLVLIAAQNARTCLLTKAQR